MGRFHALEWEDLRWFPNAWRDYGTDYLGFIATRFHIYEPILPVLRRGLEAAPQGGWVDCASGGGSGLGRLAQDLSPDHPNLHITLTDYYPNEQAFRRMAAANPSVFSFEPQSVNAMDIPTALQGKLRTLFGAFHHFRPADAQKILQNAVDTRSPIAIFEPVGRNFFSFFSMLFVIPNVLILTLFIRPVRWQVLPFIYLLPLIPLYVLWDGIASIFRIYSKKELEAMVARLEHSDSFEWEIGAKKKGPAAVQYLLGIPKNKAV